MYWRGFIVIIFVGFFAPVFASAQFVGTEPLEIAISPLYPRPGDTITVTPNSTLIDLSASDITISVNGKVINTTTGTESTAVTLGTAGKTTFIRVTAVSAGQTYTKTLSILPAEVSLVVEPISTAHPFYRGASLVASEGRVRLVALPDFRSSTGASISPSGLVYSWKLGDQQLQSSSGIGKSVLTALAPLRYRDVVVTLTVTTTDGAIVAQTSTLVAPVDPIVRIYRNDPLLGTLYSKALPPVFTLRSSEETFRAVPYYFATLPSLSWDVNGTPSELNRDITVRSTGTGSGNAYLAVNAKGVRVSATSATTLTFGQSSVGGFFGL